MERTVFKIKDIDEGDYELFERNFPLSSAHSNSLLTHSDFSGLPTEGNYHEISLALDCISYQHVDVSALSGDRTAHPRGYIFGQVRWIAWARARLYLGDYGARIPSWSACTTRISCERPAKLFAR